MSHVKEEIIPEKSTEGRGKEHWNCQRSSPEAKVGRTLRILDWLTQPPSSLPPTIPLFLLTFLPSWLPSFLPSRFKKLKTVFFQIPLQLGFSVH